MPDEGNGTAAPKQEEGELLIDENPDEEGEDIDIDADVYGATIYTLIFDLMELTSGIDHDKLGRGLNAFRLIFILCVLAGNFALQGGMIFWIYNFVVAPSVHAVQNVYQKYHAEVYDEDGAYHDELWQEWGHQEELCGIAFANFWFMFAILCLWWTTMLNEMRKNERLFKNIKSIAHTTDPNEVIVKSEDDGEEIHRVKKMTRTIRWSIYILLLLPKVLVGGTLLIIGTVWLVATDSFADLILNAIALEFVIAIDELLFEAMLPASIGAQIEVTKLWKKAKQQTPAEKEAQVMGGYRRSCFYFFGMMIAVYCYMQYGQSLPIIGVFPGYDHDALCTSPAYVKATFSRICVPGVECFPKGVSPAGLEEGETGDHAKHGRAKHGHGHHR